MPTTKQSAVGTSNFTTGHFTWPIITKVIGAFTLITLLGMLLTAFALFNLNRASQKSQEGLNLQTATEQFSLVRTALVEQQFQIEQLNAEASKSTNFSQVGYNVERSLFLVKLNNNEKLDLLRRQEQQLFGFYRDFNSLNNNSGFVAAKAVKPQMLNLNKDMLEIVDALLADFSRQNRTTLLELNQTQQQAIQATVLVSLVALGMVVGLIGFVVITVLKPLRSMNGQLSYLLWSQNDHLVERLNLLEQEINIHNEMLTAVRHDLKAPLSSMKGLAQLSTITQPDLPTDTQQHLQKIVEVADSSVATINNLLTRREIKLDLSEVGLDELVEKVLQLVDLRWFNLTRKIEAHQAIIDPALMEHALLNLVSNARKFSKGGIGVGVSQGYKPGTVDEKELEFWVWNDGITISAADREEIFKPGKQTSEGIKAGGQGLGLTIVKSIAERHHGRIIVESHEKKGTTFRLIIPVLSLDETK